MLKLFGHKCGRTELKCFQCRREICRDCLIATGSSLFCSKCAPKKRQVVRPNQFVRLEVAAIFYTFMAFGLLAYLGAGSLSWLLGAVFGVMIAEGLNKLALDTVSRKVQLGFVLGGTVLAMLLVCAMLAGPNGFSGVLTAHSITMLIMLIAIFVRFIPNSK